MKVEFWVVGKTNFDFLKPGISEFEKRIKRYIPFEVKVLADIKVSKKEPSKSLKQKEGKKILQDIKPNDYLVLLDERGKEFTSVQFAQWIERSLQHSSKRIIFQVGGAYGFSEDVYKRANAKITLSKMTFSHQLIRLIFLEQLYRAFAILNNEPYHNE